jgi:hypothetical protein
MQYEIEIWSCTAIQRLIFSYLSAYEQKTSSTDCVHKVENSMHHYIFFSLIDVKFLDDDVIIFSAYFVIIFGINSLKSIAIEVIRHFLSYLLSRICIVEYYTKTTRKKLVSVCWTFILSKYKSKSFNTKSCYLLDKCWNK